MIRSLHSELVDALPADHPAAIETRRDLRLINTLMGHVGILTRSLRKSFPNQQPSRILEIGAGDGDLLLRVARRLPGEEKKVEVVFVDLHNLLTSQTKADFAALNWDIRLVQGDIFQCLSETNGEKTDVVLANLVLHHFSNSQLTDLFSVAAKKADAFIAIEPRRGAWSLFFAESLSLIGCGPVACHDAPLSVRAGFNGRDLSALWPRDDNWELLERRAGLFSHLFIARRKV